MPTFNLQTLAEKLNAELVGDPQQLIHGIATLTLAKTGDITFFSDPKRLNQLKATAASAVITTAAGASLSSTNTLIVPNPYLAYARLTALFDNTPKAQAGIHPTAVIDPSVQLGSGVSIGPHVVLEAGVVIGEGTYIAAGVYVGKDSAIGKACRVLANVSIYHGVTIGDRVLIHAGAVIGADGFGFAHDGASWVKIAQLGGVCIGDEVEVGPNTCIDRGALEDTIIEEGVKLDDMVQIAHNVQVGAHTAMAGCSGIAGSTKVGKHCQIGGAACINGHITLADHVIIAGTAMVTKSIDTPGIYSSGTGLQTNHEWRKSVIRFRQLDDMAKRIQQLERQLKEVISS